MALVFGLPVTYIVSALAALLGVLFFRQRTSRRRLRLPPGPRPLPLIGNLLDLPKEKDWLTYRKWSEKYGDVVYVEALGQKIVVLGTAAAVNDLLEQRSAIYSNRPTIPMLTELMGFGEWLLTWMSYGETWRRGRKLLNAHIGPGMASSYYPTQLHAARKMAREILDAKQERDILPQVVRRNSGEEVVKMLYGMDSVKAESEYISLPEKVIESINAGGLPGRFLVDSLPILKHVPTWFPGADFHRYALNTRKSNRRFLDVPVEYVEADIANGSAPPSIVRSMLEDHSTIDASPASYSLIKDMAGTTYLGGADTNVAPILSFLMAMLVYPEVQAKGQEEIDRVIGTDRLPEMDDAERLPYVAGIVNECYRWLPVAPMAAPHATTRDDEYKGYLIPKGTIVLGSLWGILHNSEDYPNPSIFNPSRYLAADGTLDPSVRDPRTAVFGFGRRACPGRYIAEGSVFARIATLLATVDLLRATDANGNELVPEVDVLGGILSHPKPFEWAVRPRSRRAEEHLAGALGS